MIGQFFSLNWTMVYRMVVTPDKVRSPTTCWTSVKRVALHSNLLERQLMGDGTQGVTVRVV